MPGPATTLLLVQVGLSLVLFLLAAKVHGRQVRLARELHGFFEVDFTGDNDPWVETLWRADRRRYWTTFAVVAPMIVAGVLYARRDALSAGTTFALLPLAAVVWPMTVAFLASGLADLRRFHGDLRAPAPAPTNRDHVETERPAWLRGAVAGSVVYWCAALALAAALVVLLVR